VTDSVAESWPNSDATPGQLALQMTAGRFMGEGMESISLSILDNSYEHQADSVPSKRLQGQDVSPTQAVTANVMKSLRCEIRVEILAQNPE
jgi:hypothetical protein